MPSGSLKALLAVLAVAGFQNRDKLGEMLKKIADRSGGPPQPGAESPGGTQGSTSSQSSPGLDDMLESLRGGGLGGLFGSGDLGSVLGGGLSDLVDQFRQAGQGRKADSWVSTGANEPIDNGELQQVLGDDILRDVAAKTGLSEAEVLRRLSENLPAAVDGMTPDGEVPPSPRATS